MESFWRDVFKAGIQQPATHWHTTYNENIKIIIYYLIQPINLFSHSNLDLLVKTFILINSSLASHPWRTQRNYSYTRQTSWPDPQ